MIRTLVIAVFYVVIFRHTLRQGLTWHPPPTYRGGENIHFLP